MDAKADPNFPDAKSWPELRAYLGTLGAIPDAVRAGQSVWQNYRAHMRRNEKAHRT
jgi:hypothetical protein